MFAIRQTAVRSLRVPMTQSIRAFSGVEDAGRAWANKEKAQEEQYFKKVEADKRKALAEKIHQKELRDLLAILGSKHNLTEHQIHDILEWKHGKDF